jgi:hypothetical protein
MKSFSIVFTRTFTEGSSGILVGKDCAPIPRGVILDSDRLECRIDVLPCSMSCGDMTPAPHGTVLFTWDDGRFVAIPTSFIRTIRINE